MELNKLAILKLSVLAGTKANAYWRHAVAPHVAGLSQHHRQQARKLAYQISMSILPYTHVDQMLDKVLEKPCRASIPWDALVEQYAVDRQYVAISMLAAVERRMKDPAQAHELTRPRTGNFSLLSQCLGLFAPNISPEYIKAMAETGRFPNTLAKFNPEHVARLAADAAQRLERKRIGERVANRKYEEGQTWAGWNQARAAHVRTKAAEIVAALEDHHQASYSVTPAQPQPQAPILKVLADLAKPKGTTKRPAIAAVLVYYHKHILPELRSRGTEAPITAAIHTQAAALGQRMPQTNRNHAARCIISELTSQTTGTKFEPIWDGDADPQLKPFLSKIAA